VAAVAGQLARGQRSVDIGCLQVNLHYHPEAFPGLAEGFDPATNARYAVRFLLELRGRTGNWAEAIAQYHSADPERGAGYQRRVVLARLGAAWARGGSVPLPARSLAGLCAPGRQPALVIRRGGGGVRPRVACGRG
jgi:soluble lytic murein transglycosylase-like protein